MNRHKIGIVEDEPLSAMFVKCVLEQLGHEVLFTAASAQEALEAISRHDIEIIFMDINILGPKDGIGLALELRQKYDSLKIIFITAYTDTQTLKEASKALPSFFLAKPFDEKNIEIAVTMSIADKPAKEQAEVKIVYSFCSSGAPMRNGEYIQISPLEREIVSKLMRSKNSLVCYDELVVVASRHGDYISHGSLRNAIMRIRKKLPDLQIETVKDLGYKLRCGDGVVILV